MNPMQRIQSFFAERETASTVFKGVLGVSSTGGGLAASASEIEIWMRIASLAIGIAVGIATFISIVRKK
jgi:hypothetical protein